MVPQNVHKTIENYSFVGYGSHCNIYPFPYLTVASAVGMDRTECDAFIKRFDKVLTTVKKKCNKDEADFEEKQ